MRKLFTLISLLALASMILAACGGAAPATQAPSAATEAPSVATEAPTTAATEAPAAGEFTSSDPNTYFRPTFGEPETLDPAQSPSCTPIKRVPTSDRFIVPLARPATTYVTPTPDGP